jgi:hypothetical protein
MAGNFQKWGCVTYDDKPIRVCLMVARNKDNKEIEGFKESRRAFLTTKNRDELQNEFESFIHEGNNKEFCRLYLSVNARDPQKIYKEFLHFLIDEPNFNLTHTQSKLAGIGAKKECALEKKWMFDFDCEDEDKLHEFIEDITIRYCDTMIGVGGHKTPHGYALVVSHGFDTRELMKKWENIVTLKRDDLLCVDWYDPMYNLI